MSQGGWGSHPDCCNGFKHFLWVISPWVIIAIFVVISLLDFKPTIKEQLSYEQWKANQL